VRIGVAEGGVIAGLTGAQRQLYQFFGAAVASAERHQRRARPGEVRLQAAVVAAAADDGFRFESVGSGSAGTTGGTWCWWGSRVGDLQLPPV
jgi:class 3 adenylate cyclase